AARSARVHGFHHRPDRKRLADGQGRQRPDGNAPWKRGPMTAALVVPAAAEDRLPPVHRSAEEKNAMRHIISVLLENEPGALSRVVGLFSARGYNIETLTVAPTEDPSLSRMTIVSVGSDDVIEQITKHLN